MDSEQERWDTMRAELRAAGFDPDSFASVPEALDALYGPSDPESPSLVFGLLGDNWSRVTVYYDRPTRTEDA